MAFPVDATRNTTNITSAASPWTVNLPASIAAGDTLIMFTRTGGAQTIASVAGWTFLADDEASDASDDQTCVWYRKADGAEGATVSVTLSGNAKGAAITYRITGAIDPSLRAPEIATVAVGTGANADPPTSTPSGILKDYLFIVLAGLDGETQTFTVPTNYSNLATANSGTSGIASTNVVIGSGTRQLTAYSENPGTFTNGAPSSGWTSYTIAIHSPTPTAVTGGHFPPGHLMPRQLPPRASDPGHVATTFEQIMSAVVTTVATMTRSAGKILTAVVTTVASLSAPKIIAKTMTAVVTTVATMTRSVGKIMTAVVTTVASMTKSVGKIMTAVVTTVASLNKGLAKTLTAVVTTVASLTAFRQYLRTLTAVVTTNATMTRSVGKILTAVVVTQATMTRVLTFARTLTAVVVTVATMKRSVGKTLSAVVTTSATMTRSVGKIMTATVVVVATLAKGLSKTMTAVVSTVASLVADKIPGVGAAVARLRTLLGIGQ